MYEQNNFTGGQDNNGNEKADTTEYRYVREEIPHRSYMDASYAASGEGYTTPRSYYTPPEKLNKRLNKKQQRAEKKAARLEARKNGSGASTGGKGGRFATLVCACLVCALLGGLGGGAIVASRLPDSTEAQTQTPQPSSGIVVTVPNGGSGTSQDATHVISGETLSGSAIYTLGCEQTVAVTTEITVTNFFGMQTTTPVSGSGFIVTSDGYIVTNYHVIEDAYKGGYDVTVLMYDGTSYPAEIVGVEEQNDVAVLKIDAEGLSPATLGNSDEMQVGETVYAIGNPLGELNFTMTSGMVSALDRNITTANSQTGQKVTNNMFQIDAAVNSGNSGGPVYNEKGEVIGIVTAKYSSTGVEGLGFAIPINDAVSIINDLISKGYVTGKASFGIPVTTVDSSVAQYYNMVEGAYIYSVNEGSCAEAAGLRVGDIITAINGTEVKSSSELTYQKKSYHAGDTVTLKVYRNGEYIDVSLTFDEDLPETNAGGAENTIKPAQKEVN